MKKLISIIVPVYNVDKYISYCIESIRRQSIQNFELILVNDGSKDNSGTICDEYAQIDSRIKVIHKKNGGLMDAWKNGLEYANSDLIMFVDSDDWVEKNYVYDLVSLMKEGTAIGICGFFYHNDIEIKPLEKYLYSKEGTVSILGKIYIS